MLAVKSQNTEEALHYFESFLTRRSFVVSIQNGLNEEKIAKVIGQERTVGAFVTGLLLVPLYHALTDLPIYEVLEPPEDWNAYVRARLQKHELWETSWL